MTGDRHDPSELDAQWCAREDARALGEEPSSTPVPVDPRWASAWERERAFYAALGREAMGEGSSAAPTADALALVDAVLARHEAAGGETTADDDGDDHDGDDHDAAVAGTRRRLGVRRLALVLAVAAAVVLTVVAVTPELARREEPGRSGDLQLMTPEAAQELEASRRARTGGHATPQGLGTPQGEAPPPASATPQPPPVSEPPPPPTRTTERASKPTTDPAALLVQARGRLGEGDEAGAAKAYAALIEGHPSSAEAQAARVSLGQLRLAAGRHKAALALFERYLQRGGPLAEEARWGEIQALAALGRDEALAAAVDRLVREEPRSVYRTRAQALLKR